MGKIYIGSSESDFEEFGQEHEITYGLHKPGDNYNVLAVYRDESVVATAATLPAAKREAERLIKAKLNQPSSGSGLPNNAAWRLLQKAKANQGMI